MNLKKLFKRLGFLVLLLTFASTTVSAQTYVSATNGDDGVGDGTIGNPYRTIAVGITAAGDGGTLIIDPGVYAETMTVPDDMTITAVDFGTPPSGLNTVTVNGVVINTTNATDVVSLGETGLKFLIKTTSDLTLTKGVLNIVTGNVTMETGATITRTAGSINNTPTVTNVDVAYDGVDDIIAGAELPANLGTGDLLVGITAGKTLTISQAVTADVVTVTTGDVTFTDLTVDGIFSIVGASASDVSLSGTLTLNDINVQNNGTGDLTLENVVVNIGANLAAMIDNSSTGNLYINGTLTFVQDGTASDYTTTIVNDGGGDMTLANGFTAPGVDNGGTDYFPLVSVTNGAGDLSANGAITAQALVNGAGKLLVTGGTATTLTNSTALGTFELAADFALSGAAIANGNATAVVKLNTFTLTLSNAAVTLTNTGNFISTTASTVGDGWLALTGAKTTTTGAGELPNVNVSATSELETGAAFDIYGDVVDAGLFDVNHAVTVKGDLTVSNATVAWGLTVDGALTVEGDLVSTGVVDLVSADLTVEGNYAQNAGGTLDINAQNFDIEGDWFRDSNVLNDVAYTTGDLRFTGSGNATFTPGTQLTLFDVVVNKTLATETVTLSQSVTVAGDFTITIGTVNLADFHVRMTGLTKTFTNGSGGYTGGAGYLILESGGTFAAGPHGPGTATVLTGAALFSNIDVRNTTDVYISSDIALSGTLILRAGRFDVDANTLTLKDDLVPVPKIIRYNLGSITDLGVAGGGTAVEAGVDYDLEYKGTANIAATALDWIANEVNNLSVLTTTGKTVTNQAASTVAGILTVNGTEFLDIQNGALTLIGDSKTHAVKGTVLDGAAAVDNVVVTGDGVTIDGGTATTDARSIELLTVNLGAAAETFTLDNIINLDMLTHTLGVSSIDLVDDGKAVVADHATLGDFDINGGSVTLTLNGATPDAVTNPATLDAGSLTLGSDLVLTGAFSQGAVADAALDLGAFDLLINNNYTYDNAGGVIGTGTMTVDATGGARTITLTSALSVPNLEIVGAGNGVTLLTNNLTVSNAFTLTSGDFDLNALNLIVTGNEFNYTAGAFLSTGGDFGSDIELKGPATLVNAAIALDLSSGATDAELVVNTTGSVTFVNTTAAATQLAFTVPKLTQTAGTIDLGIHELVLNGAALGFVRTAGDWEMSTGQVSLNSGTLTFNPGATPWEVDNLEVKANAASATNHDVVVNEKLTLTAGTLTSSADDDLVITDGATIERKLTTALLSHVPTLGTNNIMIYSGAENGDITTDKELAATVADFTVNRTTATAANSEVILNAGLTISGTLYLIDGFLTETLTTGELTLASGATIDRTSAGAFTAGDVPTVTAYNLTYSGAGDIVTAAEDFLAGLVDFTIATTGGADVQLSATRAITGNFILNAAGGGYLDLNEFNFSVAGDVTVTAGNFTNTGATPTTSQFALNGAAAQTLTVPAAGLIFPLDDAVPTTVAGVEFVINNTSADGITLAGGNLTMQNNDPATEVNIVRFVNGVFKTGANVLTLWQSQNAALQPVQGYDRSGVDIANNKYSHVIGNVKKYVSNAVGTEIDRTEITFPVGTEPTSPGYYRPVSIFFKTAPQSSVNLTVRHDAVSPEGTNGIPIASGANQITNYPDFHWYVKSDQALPPSYKYDIEFQAQGYTDYIEDGIEDVRLIRRDSGNVANNWVLQGNDLNYDNSTINATWPVVKVIDAQGGITTQGSRFTYSQLNKAPVIAKTATLNSVAHDVSSNTATIVEDTDTLVVNYSATDPDIGDAATLTAVVPDGAVWNSGVVTWTPGFDQGGSDYNIIVTATDTYGTSSVNTLVVTVTNLNRDPVFTSTQADTVNVYEGVKYETTFVAEDPDVETMAYSYALTGTAPDSISLDAVSGLLTIIPAYGEAGNTFDVTVTAADATTGTVDKLVTFNVLNTNRAPEFTVLMADTTVAEAATLTLDFGANSSDPDGDALAYTFALTKAGVAVADSGAIDAVTGVYTWTPLYTQAGNYVLVVNASDGTLSDEDTLAVVVTNVNAAPTWVAELADQTVFVGDTLEFTYDATDLDNDAITYAFVGNYPTEATLDAATGEFSWIPQTALAFPVVIKVSATDGIATINTQAEITIDETTATLSGIVTYNRTTAPIVAGVIVTLSQGTTVVGKDTTDAAGAYSFAGLAGGSYSVSAAKSGSWAGVTAADALLAALYAVGSDTTLNAVQILAADVNGVDGVTNADALSILNRVVGKTTSFSVGDWVFENKDVTIGNLNVTKNLIGMVAGDVNKSNMAPAALAKESATLIPGDVVKIAPTSSFELPIKIDRAVKVGALTLELNYPTEKMEFEGISSSVSVIYNEENGKISIAWADFSGGRNGLELEESGVIAVLKFKAKDAFAQGDAASLSLAGLEIVDVTGADLNAGISIGSVSSDLPTSFALSQNYPNPFNPTTAIKYDLVANGKVNLIVYNTLGQEVTRLVNGLTQEAGSYKIDWDARNLASGMYIYRLTVEGTQNFVQTKKMILLK